MDRDYYVQMYRLEDSHWWFVARRDLACRVLRRHLRASSAPARMLDAGCGTGGTLDRVSAIGSVSGVDLEPLALSLCRERGHRDLALASANALPFGEGIFDAVLALDVLEHIPDDAGAASELARVLRPGGIAVVTVPAYPSLWSRHDVALYHQRRYYAREVRRLLTDAGLTMERLTYTVSLLFPVAWTIRMAQKALLPKDAPAKADAMPTAPWLNRLLTALLRWESRLVLRVSLPFGLTILAVARKPVG